MPENHAMASIHGLGFLGFRVQGLGFRVYYPKLEALNPTCHLEVREPRILVCSW